MLPGSGNCLVDRHEREENQKSSYRGCWCDICGEEPCVCEEGMEDDNG